MTDVRQMTDCVSELLPSCQSFGIIISFSHKPAVQMIASICPLKPVSLHFSDNLTSLSTCKHYIPEDSEINLKTIPQKKMKNCFLSTSCCWVLNLVNWKALAHTSRWLSTTRPSLLFIWAIGEDKLKEAFLKRRRGARGKSSSSTMLLIKRLSSAGNYVLRGQVTIKTWQCARKIKGDYLGSTDTTTTAKLGGGQTSQKQPVLFHPDGSVKLMN